ncbi:MAG: hypothetical protein FWD62_15725 [Betaproteobacteria bacterium]|nr:hypothetical protein [Betaproteobacteria bacterium]
MKKLFVSLLLSMFFIDAAFAFVSPISGMQNALSGSIQQKLFKRGFAANDPRFGATLDFVSGNVGAVAGGTAVIIVAGAVTAPAWATVAISLGVGAVVNYGVSLAFNGIIKWLFSPDPEDATPITVQQSQPSSPIGNGLVASGPYWQTSILGIYSGDALSAIQTAVSINWPPDSTSTYEVGVCTASVNPVKTTCLVTRVNKATGYKQTGYAAIGANYYESGAPGSCEPGFVYRASSCISVPATTETQPEVKVTAQEAIDALPEAELSKQLNPQLLASLADKMWRDAAALPGYSGLPYVATDPITATEVETWLKAHPELWPTVRDFVRPQPSTDFPWKLPSVSTATTQDPAAPSTPSTNPGASNPLENLGPDPGIGAPSLESTPTAQQILQPLLDLLPDFRRYVVPSHQATCPKPTFDVFGKEIVMEAHCTIAEDQRSALYAIMAAVWAMTAVFIILRA